MKTLKLLCIIAIILLQSCDKDSSPCRNSETNIYYNIADSNKAKIPYSGTDTLVFISDQGDTATLVGQGKKTYYITNTRDNSGNADCQWLVNKHYENVEINFAGNNQLLFNIYYRIAKTDFDPINLTGIEFIINKQNRIGSTLENAFYYLPKQDSIFINNIYKSGGYINNDKTILYNNDLGILKMNLPTFTWTKNK